MLASIITDNLNQIKALFEQHKVKELYVFGSATTDKFNEESDAFFLYKTEKIKDVKHYYSVNQLVGA